MTAHSSIEVRAPADQSEGTRAQLLRWLKNVGETVQADEPLIELETDKVTVEIPAPAAGVLAEILKLAQESVDPGELLARITTALPVADAAATVADAAATVTDAAATVTDAAATAGAAEQAARLSNSPAALSASIPSSAADSTSHGPRAHRTRRVPGDGISAPVRRLIERHHLSPSLLTGTGPGGAITVDDVLRAVEGGVTARPASEPSAAEATGPARLIPHSATRRSIAEHMVRSLLHTAPHVTTVFEADFSAVLSHRAQHAEAFRQAGAPLTLTAYVVAGCVEAIRAVPEVNARWHEDGLELFEHINIGVGTAVESKGLVVPVLRGVEHLDLAAIATGLARLVNAAREQRLTREDVRSGTFTISNHGVSGSLVAAPIVIYQPQVAILGVGKLEKRAVVMTEDGTDRIIVRPRAYLTLTIDHRVLDGDRANEFMRVLIQKLEHWPIE